MESKRSPILPRPTERAVRPSSASAKIQSHPLFYTPILDSKKRTKSALQKLGGRSRKPFIASDVKIEEEDFRASSQLRRSTVTCADKSMAISHFSSVPDEADGEEYKTKVEKSLNQHSGNSLFARWKNL